MVYFPLNHRISAIAGSTVMAAALPFAPLGAAHATTGLTQHPDYDWSAASFDNADGGTGLLRYHAPDEQEQVIAFSCRTGSGFVKAHPTVSPRSRRLTLDADGITRSFGGTVEASTIPEMPHFSSETIAVDSPLMQAFATNGRLNITIDDATSATTALAAGIRAIRQFFSNCGRHAQQALPPRR